MSLADPTKKMSKSDENANGFISVIDPPEVILKKCKRAVTDSDNRVVYEEGKDGINNLLNIYCCTTGKSMDAAVAEFDGAGYGRFKTAVAEAVIACLEPVQAEYHRLIENEDYLAKVAKTGADKARAAARITLERVFDAIGLVKKG